MSETLKHEKVEEVSNPDKYKAAVENTQALTNLTALINTFKKRGFSSDKIKSELGKVFKIS
jgi:hypothetical protein